MARKVGFVFVVLALAVTAACGSSSPSGGEASTVAPIEKASPITGGTVPVGMSDFAFAPSSFTIEAGSTITFVFTNSGRVKHEAVIGDLDFQNEHEAEMAEGGDMMEGSSDEPEVVADPGETVELTYSSTRRAPCTSAAISPSTGTRG